MKARRGALLSLLAAALLGLGLGADGLAVAQLHPATAWPDWGAGAFLGFGAAIGLVWALGWALAWSLAFDWSLDWGLRLGALSLLPALLGWAAPWAARLHLPPPHDFPLRALEIYCAAQGVSALALAVGLGLLRLFKDPALQRLSPRALALRLGCLALLAYSLSGAWTWRWHMTGDAPHYVMLADSLAYDHDIDLNNQFKHEVWRRFYNFPSISKQLQDQPDGRQLTEHKPGFAAALVPGYLLLGIEGARFSLCVFAATGTALLFLLCLRLGFERRLSLLAWSILALSSPWLQHSAVFLAELLPGLLLLAILCSWEGLLPLALAGPAMALLPWMHVRYFPVILMVAAVDWAERRRRKTRLWPPWLWAVLGLGSALLFNQVEFGSMSVAHTYEQRHTPWSTLIQVWQMPRYIGGLLIDQEYGWLPYAPVFLVSFYGLWALWRRERRLFWLTVLPSLSYLGPIAVFPWWYSGTMPNRYIVPLTPFFALWAVEAWRAWGWRRGFMALAWASWGWGFLLTVLPWLSWGRENGQNWILRILGARLKVDLCPYFPSFFLGSAISYAWLAAFLLAALAWARRLGPPAAPQR